MRKGRHYTDSGQTNHSASDFRILADREFAHPRSHGIGELPGGD
jgi:hypothetical protein